MPQSIVPFLTMLSRSFCNDELAQVAQHFTYPMPLYLKDDLLVFGSAEALTEALSAYRAGARKADITRIDPRVVASGLPRKGYATLWVEWDHFDSTNALICTSQVRYAIFQDQPAAQPRIEMVDYTAVAFPEVSEALPLVKSA
ncbi:MAG: hypothetical protein AAGF36_13800 [Pseudomonadota bacterium]